MKNIFNQIGKSEKQSKRKKVLIIMGILLISNVILSQMAVTDVANDKANAEQLAQVLKQLEEAKSQTEQLMAMKDNIQKNLEFLQQVNQNLQNLQRIKNIAQNQASIYNECFALKNQFAHSDFPEVILAAEQSTNSILTRTQGNILELSQILRAGFFNMNDAERLRSIREFDDETNSQLMQIKTLKILISQCQDNMRLYNNLQKN